MFIEDTEIFLTVKNYQNQQQVQIITNSSISKGNQRFNYYEENEQPVTVSI